MGICYIGQKTCYNGSGSTATVDPLGGFVLSGVFGRETSVAVCVAREICAFALALGAHANVAWAFAQLCADVIPDALDRLQGCAAHLKDVRRRTRGPTWPCGLPEFGIFELPQQITALELPKGTRSVLWSRLLLLLNLQQQDIAGTGGGPGWKISETKRRPYYSSSHP